MRYIRLLFALSLLLILSAGIVMAKQNKLPMGFYLEPSITGLDRPSALAITNDGRVYIGERFTGKVFLVRYGKLIATPVITVSVATGIDEGLLDIAFDPKGPESGYLYLFYTDAAHSNKVVRYTLSGLTASNPLTIIDLGSSPGATRIGGGIVVGNDGKIYISVGDFENSTNAQDDASNKGKVLRLNSDGTVPADNPTPGSANFAKGFRDGAGLAAHSNVPTLYQLDRGPGSGYDELNAISAGNNYGWDIGTGPLGSPYTDPLDYRAAVVPSGISAYIGMFFPDQSADGTDNDLDGTVDERDEKYSDSIFYGLYNSNDIIRSSLTGTNLTSQYSALSFFDGDIEWDGTADTQCPIAWTDFDESKDEILYGISEDSIGTKDGLYRFVYDRKGPREVSPPGSLFPLTIEKTATTDLNVYWENVEREAWIGAKLGSTQPTKKYTIWEGTLPITGGTYNHTAKLVTDGSAVNNGLLTAAITPLSGNQYYLVSSQGANQEGSLGKRTGGTERTNPRPTMDYCNEIGWWTNEDADVNKETQCDGIDNDGDGRIDESCAGTGCGPDFKNKLGQPVKLLDQYGNYWSLHDFRGSVIHMDISSFT